MSTGHENVVWQSSDGTWSRGFYLAQRYYGDDDSDPEVEYDQNEFEWVSTGHPTEQAAHASWRGANPGHSTSLAQPTTPEQRAHWGDEHEHLDDLAAKLWADPNMRYMCHGTPKRRSPRFLAHDIATATADAAHYRLGGYANLPVDVSAETAELRSRLRELTGDQRTAVSAELRTGAERIEKAIRSGTSWRGTRPSPDALQQAEEMRDALLSLTADVAGADVGQRPEVGPARAKTTPNSTAGSFAPKRQSAPDVTLGVPGT